MCRSLLKSVLALVPLLWLGLPSLDAQSPEPRRPSWEGHGPGRPHGERPDQRRPEGALQAPVGQLFRLMESGRRQNYAGRQVMQAYLNGRPRTGSARVACLNGWTRTEMLSPERMRGMVVLERGGRQLVRYPGQPNWQSRPGAEPPPSGRLLRNYTATVEGNATIAGRAATILTIRPRQSDALARKLWIDSENGVVLRTELYNWTGQLVTTTEFKEIDFKAELNEADFQVVPGQPLGGSPRPGLQRPPVEVPDVPSPRYIPAGYVQTGRPHLVNTPVGKAVHFRYSDGLNGISVFVRRLNAGESSSTNRPPAAAMEQPFSSVVHYVKGDYRVTVIGDIAPAEVRRMAASVE